MKKMLAFALVLLMPLSAAAQVKKPEPAAVKIPFTKSLQAVVVTSADWNTVTGKAQLFERQTDVSNWKAVGSSFPVVLGRSGLAWGDTLTRQVTATKIKREGDGNSPAGMFPLTAAFGTGSKPNAVELPYRKLDEFTECVDDVKSFHYNKIVGSLQVGIFDWKSTEKMLAIGEQYHLGVFVAYNSYPVVKGRGSCIFLHIWKTAATGTAGCTAMERRDLERIVAWASPAKNPYLIQLTDADYTKYRKSWNLPKLK